MQLIEKYVELTLIYSDILMDFVEKFIASSGMKLLIKSWFADISLYHNEESWAYVVSHWMSYGD